MKKQRKYYFRRYILPYLAKYIGVPLLHSLLFTCKITTRGSERFFDTAEKGGCFLSMWHDSLPAILHILYRQKRAYHHFYAAVVSNSRDAELLAKIVSSYPQGEAIRVSHKARHVATTKMMRALEKGKILLITPDGPRGPARKVKPGTAFASIKSQAPIFPLTWEASHYWTLPTWDNMRIPKPFSTIIVNIENAVIPAEKETTSEVVKKLQNAMNESQASCFFSD